MSTSDSDESFDWLASGDDAGPKRTSRQRMEESPLPPSPTPLSSSLRESSTCCFHYQRRRKKKRRSLDEGCSGVDDDFPAVAPLLGSTLASERFAAASRRHVSGKRRGGETMPPDSEKELFSQKRAELQHYVWPLSSILRGLRSGRYSDRLSSFQERVAMDRIQRLMGVLQNPHISGHFLSIILKIEAMLQSWFPHIRPDPTQTGCGPSASCRVSGIPAKKQKHHSGAASPPPSSAVSFSTPPAHCTQEVTQDSTVSSSTDPRLGTRSLRSPVLERLLQSKESIIAPRTEGDDVW
ncbi:uncharacterized protein [Clinocottus analis]|uniref:uncharacterized protein n=1 Tax=Clinocottus analis TaxID=304258 RepID=UPI0035C08771